MNLQEQISRIHSMMGTITEDDKSNKFNRIISLSYPNFNKEGVDVEEKEFGTLYKYIDKNDPNLLYAKYWNVVKELQLNKEVFDFLDDFTSEEVFDEVINWFNNEFGTDAEYVTY